MGGSGPGKTVTTKAFMTRAALKYGLKLLIIDWNGEYESPADSIGATTWHVPKELKTNPFALSGSDGNFCEVLLQPAQCRTERRTA